MLIFATAILFVTDVKSKNKKLKRLLNKLETRIVVNKKPGENLQAFL